MPEAKLKTKLKKQAFSVLPALCLMALSAVAVPMVWSVSSGTGPLSTSAVSLYICLLSIIACAMTMLLQNLSAGKSHFTLLSAHQAAHDLLENRLMAIEASHEGVAIINPLSQLTYMNNALFDIYGIPQEAEDQFIGENWLRLFPEARAEFMADKALLALEREGFWAGHVELKMDGGAIQILDIALSRLPDGGLICTTRDMTERDKSEKEKKQLEEQFYQAQKMEAVGRLAGGIAHDFNNILAAINGYAEFLEEDLEEGTQQQTFAKNILKAGKEAKVLVDQMLAFSRRKDSAMEPVDLVVSMQEAVSILHASLPKSIEIKTDYKIPKAIVRANASQIMQVLMNLCVNARDAIDNDRGEINIGVTVKSSQDFPHKDAIGNDLPDPKVQPPTRLEDGEAGTTRLVMGQVAKNRPYVVMRIADTGCGMSRVVMEHIFEPFFTTKPVNKGTGLGMATVHGVVTGHQAAMIIESTLGQGTSFELYFPADDQDMPLVSGEEKNQDKEKLKGNALILLVEDQDSVRDMMFNMLTRLGYTVKTCASGLDALDMLREFPNEFDLVITDENMPKMTGTELVYQVHFDFPDIPFIMVTGYTQQQLENMAKEHPAIKAIMKKPVTKEILAQQIAAVLESSSAKKNKDKTFEAAAI